MTEEKRNRIIAAITVNIVLLAAVLFVIVLYQIGLLISLNNLKNAIQKDIDYYETQIQKDRDTLDYYKEGDGLLDKAYEWGFRPAK